MRKQTHQCQDYYQLESSLIKHDNHNTTAVVELAIIIMIAIVTITVIRTKRNMKKKILIIIMIIITIFLPQETLSASCGPSWGPCNQYYPRNGQVPIYTWVEGSNYWYTSCKRTLVSNSDSNPQPWYWDSKEQTTIPPTSPHNIPW